MITDYDDESPQHVRVSVPARARLHTGWPRWPGSGRPGLSARFSLGVTVTTAARGSGRAALNAESRGAGGGDGTSESEAVSDASLAASVSLRLSFGLGPISATPARAARHARNE